MTLIEKFEEIDKFTFIRKSHNVKCEKLADDYAIEFAKWYHSVNNNEYHLYPNANIEKHLKIFKKKKGL